MCTEQGKEMQNTHTHTERNNFLNYMKTAVDEQHKTHTQSINLSGK